MWKVLLKLQRSYRCAIQKDEFYIKDRHICLAEHQYLLTPIQVPVFINLVYMGRSSLALFILAVLYSSNICRISFARRDFAQKAKSRVGTLVTRAYIKESTYR